MARSRKLLTGGALGVAAVALLAATAGTTGAYFSEAKGDTITGTLGAVHLEITPSNINFSNLLPGAAQTATVQFKNTGTVPQDFYVVFPNGPALHALNNLGSFGEVHLAGGPDGASAALFDSANLQDGRTRSNGSNSCGDFDPAACWPLKSSYKLASNVPRNEAGSFSFTFNYAGKLGNANPTSGRPASSGGGTFNSYPSNGPGGEAFGADALGTPGNGLPFQVVATQVGQTP